MILLPRMVVHGAPVAPPAALPRIAVRPAGQDIPAEPFESPSARDARLVKKHLSAFDRFFLNRYNLFGASKEQRARNAEAIEQGALQLNDLADELEFNRHPGKETAADRKLREAYLDLYMSRPR